MKLVRYAFSPFVVETSAGNLHREAKEIVVRAKTRAVLCYLLERPGQEVSKDERLKNVWAGTYENDGASRSILTSCAKRWG